MNFFLEIFIIFGFTTFFTFIFIKVFSFLFYKFDILDNPKKYNKKRAPIPYGIGIIFFLIFCISSIFFVSGNLNETLFHKLELIWIFGGIITFLSFLDDRLHISPLGRLIVQILIGLIIGMTSIKIGYISGIFSDVIDLEKYNFFIFDKTFYIVPVVFTMFWYVFIFNSLNWTDGITGNTTLLSLVNFSIIAFLGLKLYFTDSYVGGIENAKFIIKICIILFSILFVYFFFDIKEKVLMGDSGTMFLGFMLASIAIISGGKVATVLAVFGVYSVDAIYVGLKRIYNKKNPLKGDFTHLHHRLIDAGLKRNEVLFLIGISSFLFGFTSLFLEKIGKIVLFIFIILFVLFIEKFIIFYNSKKIGK